MNQEYFEHRVAEESHERHKAFLEQSIDKFVKDIIERIVRLEFKNEELESIVSDLQNEIIDLRDNKLNSLEADISSIRSDVDDLRTDVDDLRSDVDG